MSSVSVSVIIPCHNAAEFLEGALQSVRHQTLGTFECLIVDDRSTDDSSRIAARFVEADARFRIVTMSGEGGAAAARNAGVGAATGRWLTMLDADDLYVADRLERLTQVAEEVRADMVFDDLIVTEYPAATSRRRAFGFERSRFNFTPDDFFVGSRLFRRPFPIGYMKPLINRESLKRVGAAYDPSVPSGEDFLFYAQLFAAGASCVATSFAGYVYRRRRGSLSRSDEHLHQHAQLGERVMQEFGARLSETSRNALADRGRDFARVAEAMPAMSALRRRQWRVLASLLLERPTIAATGISLLKTRAARSWSAARRIA